MSLSLNGHQIYRGLLLLESTANIAATITMIFEPERTLSMILRGPSQITPAIKTMEQWIGGILVVIAVPLILSYPERSGPDHDAAQVIARRRLTYQMLGAGEVALALLTASQYLRGDSGMTNQALLIGTGMCGFAASMRAFFLYVRPEWMQPQEQSEKGGEQKR